MNPPVTTPLADQVDRRASPTRRPSPPRLVRWLTSTDHKVIGMLYLVTSFAFFLIAGVMAMWIRLELWEPGIQFVQSKQQYNMLFTMHGTIMLLLFATALFAGSRTSSCRCRSARPTSPSRA